MKTVSSLEYRVAQSLGGGVRHNFPTGTEAQIFTFCIFFIDNYVSYT